MDVTTLGIDLAKNVVQVHGVATKGHVVLRKRLSRAKVLPCLIPNRLDTKICDGTSADVYYHIRDSWEDCVQEVISIRTSYEPQ